MFIISAPDFKFLLAVFLINFMYLSYMTLSIIIRRKHVRKTETHDDDNNEKKQTEDNGEAILG